MGTTRIIWAGLAGVLLLAGAAHATSVFTGTSGNLSARAEFDYDVLGQLKVTLTNTSTADVLKPADVLTAVFFDVNPSVTFTKISVMLAEGSVVHFGADNGGNVGGEFAFRSDLSGAPGGAVLGLSSAGFGDGENDMFGPQDLFPGPDLQEPESPDGLQYGLTSAGDDMTTGNKAVTDKNALIQNSVVFLLGYSSDVDLTISNVSFQYGTALDEPNIVPGSPIPPIVIPEPLTLASFFLAVSGLGVYRYRRGRG